MNLQHVIDANNHETTYTYNAENQQTDITPPDLSDQHTDYNLDGTIEDQKDGLNNTISYGYDSQARMTLRRPEWRWHLCGTTHRSDGLRLRRC